jgi:hypothetical protein
MKKIFLLSLLSVLFLSAFSQKQGKTEILAKINITSSMTDEEGTQGMGRGWWIFFYRFVTTTHYPDGSVIVQCSGWGRKCCIPKFERLPNGLEGLFRSPDAFDPIFEELVTESNEKIAAGEYSGTVSKTILIPENQMGGKDLYLFFLMKWENDPLKPYNGKAEIIISKTYNLGL